MYKIEFINEIDLVIGIREFETENLYNLFLEKIKILENKNGIKVNCYSNADISTYYVDSDIVNRRLYHHYRLDISKYGLNIFYSKYYKNKIHLESEIEDTKYYNFNIILRDKVIESGYITKDKAATLVGNNFRVSSYCDFNLIEGKRCDGSIFRASVQHYTSKRGFGFSVKLNKLIRNSCRGCELCSYEQDLYDDISLNNSIMGIEKAINGKTYKVIPVITSIDLESGISDDFNLKLIEYDI